jgi:hypothetical protein
MIRQIVETTDGKYLGLVFDDQQTSFIAPDGILFKPTKTQDLGDGVVRYSNSNYVVTTKEVKTNGQDHR